MPRYHENIPDSLRSCIYDDPPQNRRGLIPVMPEMHSRQEWRNATAMNVLDWEATEMVAEDFELATRRLMDSVNERTENALGDLRITLQSRLKDLEHWRDELLRTIPEMKSELDALATYGKRVEIATKAICHVIDIDSSIIHMRNCRSGMELVDDVSTQFLQHEIRVVHGTIGLLKRSTQEIEEQKRIIRKAVYQVDKDMKDKDMAVKVDRLALSLSTIKRDLARRCDPENRFIHKLLCDVEEEDWVELTNRHRKAARSAITTSRDLRVIVDQNLRSVTTDVQYAMCETNKALKNWLQECVMIKDQLQMQWSDITVKLHDLEISREKLERTWKEKGESMAAVEKQICLRNRRPRAERVRDGVCEELSASVATLGDVLAKLNQQIQWAEKMKENLAKAQLELSEEINNKILSIEIEEVHVVPMRSMIFFPQF